MPAAAANVTFPWVLHAQANAVSASRNRYPPWQVPWPFSIWPVIVIWARAWPGPGTSTVIPAAAAAVSPSNIAAAERCARDLASWPGSVVISPRY
jgi:hypothetical protein